MEVTPEGTFAIDQNGNRVLVLGPQTPQIISLEDLMNTLEAVRQKENADRLNLENFFNPSQSTLRESLTGWAAAGFPAIYCLFGISIDPPKQCSDGVTRQLFEYVEYLLGRTVGSCMQRIEAMTSGIQFSHSITLYGLNIHVSKY